MHQKEKSLCHTSGIATMIQCHIVWGQMQLGFIRFRFKSKGGLQQAQRQA